jgi:hypothetical protein
MAAFPSWLAALPCSIARRIARDAERLPGGPHDVAIRVLDRDLEFLQLHTSPASRGHLWRASSSRKPKAHRLFKRQRRNSRSRELLPTGRGPAHIGLSWQAGFDSAVQAVFQPVGEEHQAAGPYYASGGYRCS